MSFYPEPDMDTVCVCGHRYGDHNYSNCPHCGLGDCFHPAELEEYTLEDSLKLFWEEFNG